MFNQVFLMAKECLLSVFPRIFPIGSFPVQPLWLHESSVWTRSTREHEVLPEILLLPERLVVGNISFMGRYTVIWLEPDLI